MSVLAPQIETVRRSSAIRYVGRVSAVRGMLLLVDELPLPIGALVHIDATGGGASVGEVVGFDNGKTMVMMLGGTDGIRAHDRVAGEQAAQTTPVGERMLGRIINGLAQPIDDHGPIHDTVGRPLEPDPTVALDRARITQPIQTGVRSLDLMTTMGTGQRMGIFAGPGVGKSTMLGMIARHTSADVNVIALIGERGREVREFIEGSLGDEGLARSVIVVATSDESPLMRVRAAKVACAAAEHFRDQGLSVMLMMDSVTRFAHAQRQIGLSIGEPPATKGYTPSVFAQLARMLERAGGLDSSGGSITGVYTILVEGDDMTEPISDAVRGILDGHVVLSRKLAQQAHFPAVDVLDSVSRVAEDICSKEHSDARRSLMRLLATYREIEDLVQIGAYARGSNAETDAAIEYKPKIDELLRQSVGEHEAFDAARQRLESLAGETEAWVQAVKQAGAGGGASGGRS
jgi:flagellum-specific ATP synthase